MTRSILTTSAVTSFLGYFGDNVSKGQMMVPIADDLKASTLTFHQEPLTRENAGEFCRLGRQILSEPLYDRRNGFRKVTPYDYDLTMSDDLWCVSKGARMRKFVFCHPLLKLFLKKGADSPFYVTITIKYGLDESAAEVRLEYSNNLIELGMSVYLSPGKIYTDVACPTYYVRFINDLESLKRFLGIEHVNSPLNVAQTTARYLGGYLPTIEIHGNNSREDRMYQIMRSGQEGDLDISVHLGHPYAEDTRYDEETQLAIYHRSTNSSPSLDPFMISLWDLAMSQLHQRT